MNESGYKYGLMSFMEKVAAHDKTAVWPLLAAAAPWAWRALVAAGIILPFFMGGGEGLTEEQKASLQNLLEEQKARKKAESENQLKARKAAQPRYGTAALTWGVPGAAVGGLTGAILSKNKDKTMPILAGSLLGGGLGAGFGTLREELKYRKWLGEQGTGPTTK